MAKVQAFGILMGMICAAGAATGRDSVRYFNVNQVWATPSRGDDLAGARRVGLASAGTFLDNGLPVRGAQDNLAISCGARDRDYPCFYALAVFLREGKLYGYSNVEATHHFRKFDPNQFLQIGEVSPEGEVAFTLPGFHTRAYRSIAKKTGQIETVVYLQKD